MGDFKIDELKKFSWGKIFFLALRKRNKLQLYKNVKCT